MEIQEIIMEALHFPFNNITSLAVYLVLGIIVALIAILTGVTGMFGISQTSGTITIISLIGIILCLIIYFIINGYELDIIKSGINRSSDAPSIDITRQTLNGVKLFVVQIIYFIIPILITLISALVFTKWVTALIACVIFIIFGFIETMGECRLAQTEDLNHALKINEAFGDIQRIGVTKVVVTIIAVAVIYVVITNVFNGIFGFINQDLGTIVSVIVAIYLVFFENRATGLLYSDIN